MAEGVNRGELGADATDEGAGAGPHPLPLTLGPPALTGPSASPHADKFRVATAVLIGIAVGAVAIAIAVLVHGSSRPAPAPRWSTWVPAESGTAAATEIAEHVAPLYRLTAANQMDVVTQINLANPNSGGTTTGSGLTVAVGSGPAGSHQNLSLLSGQTIAYNVCGIGGSDCGLGGTPSPGRMLLLRREALELALYTFKYAHSAANVLAILPPGKTQTVTPSPLTATRPSATTTTSSAPTPITVAVLFLRSELQPWLSAPLADTLAQYPPLVGQISSWQKTNEAGLVSQITERGLFSEKIEAEQDGGNLLVLTPLPPE